MTCRNGAPHYCPNCDTTFDYRELVEAVQRERDRAQAIILAASRGQPLSWGMYLKAGQPDHEAIAADAVNELPQ